MELYDGTHYVNGSVLDAMISFSRLDIISHNTSGRTVISSNASTRLLEVRAGAPPVMLQGLEFDGQVRIESSTEFSGCRFGSVSMRRGRRLKAGTVRALLVSDGHVSISDTVFEGLLGGAIEVSGGSLAVHTSVFQNNKAKSGGALLVTGGKVKIGNSTFTDNQATGGRPGGAIHLNGTNASLELANKTRITGSKGYGGSIVSDVPWTYRLPAPLAHYVSNPEQDGVAQNVAGSYDYDYPIPCSATLYGNSYEVRYQSSPSCEGSCEGGNYCGKMTRTPKLCKTGTYCPPESASETACPAGTYNKDQQSTSIDDCLACKAGTFCPEISTQTTPCATGTYANESRQKRCMNCPEGKFQNLTAQLSCESCEPGSYCQMQSESQGASTPTQCRAGSYSSSTNLSSADHCSPCPLGFYCEAGATEPIPCPEGKEGTDVRLTSVALCTTCKADTTSLPGERCTYCKKDFYQGDTKCEKCLELQGDGAVCSETTTNGVNILTHGPRSLAEVRIKPNYWRLGENSMTLTRCLESADRNSSCAGGSDAGNEDQYKKGYTGNGYCKARHTGPLCQVCNTSDFYFDKVVAMECVQCPTISEKLDLPMGFIGVLVVLLLTAFIIKRSPSPVPSPIHCGSSFYLSTVRTSRRCSERLREPIAEVKRVVARIRQLDIVPRCKLLFT